MQNSENRKRTKSTIKLNGQILEERKIEAEAREKTKTKHWAELNESILPHKRPDYMDE